MGAFIIIHLILSITLARTLQLRDGKLHLHSNLISKFDGLMIGEGLDDTKWQKIYVAVNSSHLTLGVDNGRLQATQPINPTGENDTVFFNTYLGGAVSEQQILANNAPSFTGCIQVLYYIPVDIYYIYSRFTISTVTIFITILLNLLYL